MLDFKLKVFLEVVEKKSFSKAAESLHLTQPAVTFQIKQLEEFYRTRLFDRYQNAIALTEAGETLYTYAKQIQVLYNQADKAIDELTGLVRGQLLIGASTTVGEYILPRLIGAFNRKFPKIDVRLDIGNSSEIVSQVLDNILDVGLVGRAVQNKNLTTVRFIEDELVLAVYPGHIGIDTGEIDLEQAVQNCRFILREEGSATRDTTLKGFKEKGIQLKDLNVVLTLGSSEAIKGAIEAGMGVSILSKWTILKELKLGTLQAIRIQGLSLHRDFNFIYLKGQFKNKAVEEFLKFATSFDVATLTAK